MQKVLSVINIAKIKLKDPKKNNNKDQRPRYNSETIHNWTQII